MRSEEVQRAEGFIHPQSTKWVNPADLPRKDSGRIYIYRITNLINGKNCIGQTNNLRQRFHQYSSAATRKVSKQAIQCAINKYGFENFSFEQIATCQNQQDADDTETLLIQQYRSHVSLGNGYNVDLGGQGKNAIKSEETCRKISEALIKHYEENDSIRIGGTHTEQAKRNMSIASMGKAGTNTGKIFPDEWRLKMSKSLVGMEKKALRRFTEEVELEICGLYADGLSMFALGKRFGCGRNTIDSILRRNGIEKRITRQSTQANGRNLFTRGQEEEICEAYKTGKESFAGLGKKFGCHPTTIRDILIRHGVKL